MVKFALFPLNFSIAYTIVLLNLILAVVSALYPLPLALVVGFGALLFGLITKKVKIPGWYDFVLSFFITLSLFVLLVALGVLAFQRVSLFEIILMGLLIDFIGWVSGKLPVAGDFAGGVLVMILVPLLFGLSLFSVLLASVGAIILFIPFLQELPVVGWFSVTIVFVIIKILFGGG